MMNVSAAARMLLCLALFAVCGCASSPHYQVYEGERRNPDDVAVLYVGGKVNVQSVNDRTPGYLRLGRINNVWCYPDVLELLPGTYRIVVSYGDESLLVSQPSTAVRLEAQAGHSYTIGAIVYMRGQKVKAWRAAIVDNGAGFNEGVSPEPVYRQLEELR